MDRIMDETENRKRIREVENAFTPAGMPLFIPGRVLIGEGVLTKQGRKKQEQKAFFLFNDIMVYGSVIVNGRWYKKQKVIALKDVKIEDLENNKFMQHQWMICTPRKSFYVSAPNDHEKQAWIKHITECQDKLLKDCDVEPGSDYAISWIPDKSAQKCMRCLQKFSPINRRHHCRKCGFVVCNTCSKERELIKSISSTHKLRICKVCKQDTDDDVEEEEEEGEDSTRQRGDSSGMHSSEEEEEEEGAASGDEEQIQTSSSWLDTRDGTWGRLSAVDS